MHNAVHIDWQPIKARRASEDIYAQLRDLITSGALKPGDRLPSERAMMEQLQRSRPTIREALRMLEQGGYVASTHGASGAVVQELTIDGVEEPLAAMLQVNQISLEELGEYRESNDGTIAAWAAQRRTEDDLSALRHENSRFAPRTPCKARLCATFDPIRCGLCPLELPLRKRTSDHIERVYRQAERRHTDVCLLFFGAQSFFSRGAQTFRS